MEIDKTSSAISCNLVSAFQKQEGFSVIKEQKKQKCLEDISSTKISRPLSKAIKGLIEDE
jgi:hypothetical protein